ncbi:MAG: TonB-dependent receptor [Idiomarina sp.]|nr:TonB-dependent receptor [Idiomarina sp.]
MKHTKPALVTAIALCQLTLQSPATAANTTPTQASHANPTGEIERIAVHGRAPLPNATIIRMDDIYRPGMTLRQILRSVPGLYVRQSGGLGGEMSLSLDGSSGSQVLVLLDGEPLTSSTLGTPLLQHIDPAELSAIEVVYGSSAAAYGAGAMAGAINLRTRSGGQQVVAVSGLFGSWVEPHHDTPQHQDVNNPEHSRPRGMQAYVRLAGNLGPRSSGAFSYSKRDERQPIERRGELAPFGGEFIAPLYQSDSLSLNLTHERSNNRTVNVSHRSTFSKADYQQDCLDTLEFQPLACQPWLKTRQNLTRIEQSRQFGPRTRRLSLSYFNDDATSYDRLISEPAMQPLWSGFGERYSSQRWRAAYVSEHRLQGGGMVTRGIDWQREYADSNAFEYMQQSRARFSVFNQYMSAGGSGLGLRAERLGSGSWVVAGDAQYAKQFNPQFDALVKVSNGYREPGFNDLFWPGAGNPELNRERSQSVYTQLNYQQGPFSASVRPFYQRWRDLIAWAPVDTLLWQPQNVDRASSRGLTLTLQQQLSERLSLEGSLTLQDPRDDQHNQRLPYRATELGQLQLKYEVGLLTWALEAQGRNGLRTNNGEPLPGYVLYSGSWQWGPSELFFLSLRVDNFTNTRYAERVNWFEPGRQMRLGFTWRY